MKNWLGYVADPTGVLSFGLLRKLLGPAMYKCVLQGFFLRFFPIVDLWPVLSCCST